MNQQPKKVEINNKRTIKTRLIPYSGKKRKKHINDNKYSSNSYKKKNKNNITETKLKKNNIISKTDLFINYYDTKVWKDNFCSNKKIKNVTQTPKHIKRESFQYNLNFNTELLPINYININSNAFTENRKRNYRTEIFDTNNTNNNISNNINELNKSNNNKKIDKRKIFSNKENYNEYHSIELDEPKISKIHTNKKNRTDFISQKKAKNKIASLSEYNYTQESPSYNDIKTITKKYMNTNLKDINLLDSDNYLENNNYLNIHNNILENKSNKNILAKKYNRIKNLINIDSGKNHITLSPHNKSKNNYYNINVSKKNNNNININIDEYNSKKELNIRSKEISNKKGNKLINNTEFTEYSNDLNLNKINKNIEKKSNRQSHILLKSISYYKKLNNPVKLSQKKKELTINKPIVFPSNVRRIYIPNQNSNIKYNKCNNTVETKDFNINNNSISSCYKKIINNNNIININNNSSNVNVLNVKNSSINIHFDKKDRFKDLSSDKNFNYITTVNNIHRNNKLNVKSIGNEERNKNPKNYNKIKKSSLNRDNYASFIRISKNSMKKKNNLANTRNDNRFYINHKNGNSKVITAQLSMNNSQTRLQSSIMRMNKELTDNKFNKINMNDNKDIIDNKDNIDNTDTNLNINLNKIHLNTPRSDDIHNIDNNHNTTTIKIPIKDNSNNNKKNKIIIMPLISTNNSISQNKKSVYGIYIKPTCILSREKSKNKKSKSEAKSKFDYFNQNTKNNSTNKNTKIASNSLNNEKHSSTPPYFYLIKDKYNLSKKLNSHLQAHKSLNILSDSSIDNSNIIKKERKRLDFDLMIDRSENNNIAKEAFIKNYCFYFKFYNYFLKRPNNNICYSTKQNIKKHLNKEQTLKLNNFNKDNSQKYKISDLSIENINKNEKISNNDTNKKSISNKKIIINEEEKINESSQNGLIMTFGDVNDNKNKNEKINNKNNDIISQLNNVIINDESLKSDIDIYKKLDILQPEAKNKIENDNISENEDIQFYFSDEEVGATESNFQGPLYNSNNFNKKEILYPFDLTNGKEINDIDKNICKTFKKCNNIIKNNLENAEKGFRILKKIALRRGYKSDDENYNKKITIKKYDDDINKNKNRYNIYLGTNKLNELFNSRQESKSSFNNNKCNSSYNVKYRSKYSRSVNKDIVKGISKIENFFEKKNRNHKNNIYERKYRDNDYDYSDENSCNIDNILDYDDEIKPKIRTYVQKGKNNLYFSISKTGKESTNINDYNTKDDDNMYMYENHLYGFTNEENNNTDLLNHNEISIPKINEIKYLNNDIENNIKKEAIRKNNLLIKENLFNEFKKDIINDNTENTNSPVIIIESNIDKEKNKIREEKNAIESFNQNNYLHKIKENQSINKIKNDIIYLLNIITEDNYNNIINQITDIILYQNTSDKSLVKKDLNDNENIIKNEHTLKDIIFNKATTESIYSFLYAKIFNHINNNISNALIDQKNLKNNKERNLKFIISEECMILLNKYKEYINLFNKECYEYYASKTKLIGYANFICELIDLDLIKQQFGFYTLEQFYKKYIDNNEANNIFKNIFLEICIVLVNKLGKIYFDKNNKKLIQNIDNFIKKNLTPIINDECRNNNNNDIPSNLKYRIINIIKKNENSWKESLFEKYKKDKKIFDFKDEEKEVKVIRERSGNNNTNNLKKIIICKKEEKEKIDYKVIIEEDLKNYISYFTEQGDNGEINIKSYIDKSYNWKVIDELVNEKNYGLEYIINIFIQICSNMIKDEKQLLLCNDYIKNIIEFYSNNLSKKSMDLIHNEMIQLFLKIDEVIKINCHMSKIVGNLLFILIENRLYHIKDFNNYLKAEMQTQINLAIITRYCIISAGKFAKKYFNDFKQTKLFFNNNIFNQYVTIPLKDLFYFIK